MLIRKVKVHTCLIGFKGVRLILFVSFLSVLRKNLAKYKSKSLGRISSTLQFSPTIHALSSGQNLFLLLFFMLSTNSDVCFVDQPIYISCHFVPVLCYLSPKDGLSMIPASFLQPF